MHTLCASDCFNGTFCQSHPVQSNLSASSILDATYKPLSSLCVTQIFYTDFLCVNKAINLKINCVASDIRYLRKFGAYLKSHVAGHPDGSNLQLLNYCIQTLLQVLTCRASTESLLFRIQSIFSYYFSRNGFCDINIISHVK